MYVVQSRDPRRMENKIYGVGSRRSFVDSVDNPQTSDTDRDIPLSLDPFYILLTTSMRNLSPLTSLYNIDFEAQS